MKDVNDGMLLDKHVCGQKLIDPSIMGNRARLRLAFGVSSHAVSTSVYHSHAATAAPGVSLITCLLLKLLPFPFYHNACQTLMCVQIKVGHFKWQDDFD